MQTESDTANTNTITPPPVTPKITRARIKLELPVPLTERELVETARGKAGLERELDELLDQFADVKDEWNRRLEQHRKRIAELGADLLNESQKRIVDCFERYVTDGEHAGKIETVRHDTQDVVERRVANLLEARQALPPEDDDVPEVAGDILAEAARMQREAGVEETEDGDVVVPEGDGKRPKKKGSKK